MRTGIAWLDVKLGLRMLRRYPGLTVVSSVAMAFAIAAGASVFQFLNQMTLPQLPLPDGDRVVGIRLWDTASRRVERHASFDFGIWRSEVASLESVGAFRSVDRNLTGADGRSEPIQLAEISASAFKVARAGALVGRALVDADEQAGATPVVVLGYDIWQSRFGGDSAIVGQSVRLGNTVAAVAGVMPKGFKFPISHDAWIPLRLNFSELKGRQGPEIYVFGRLAAGVGIGKTGAELTTIGLRLSAEFPDTHEYLRPEVVPYARSIRDLRGLDEAALLSINIFLIMLLVLVCGNVALLVFARAATRESEIVVRTALGAGRRRIIAQLFIESLVLTGVAAPLGLAAAQFLLRWWFTVAEIDAGGRLPFWFSDRLAVTTVLYALGLTLIGAIISGVIPALKLTGREIEVHLRQSSVRGGGPRFGGVWTWVIVTQVAVTLAFPATVFLVRRGVVELQSLDAGFAANEYLSARLELDREKLSASTYEEIERRLTSERGVAGVTFTSQLPRTGHPQRWLEIDRLDLAAPAADSRRRVSTVSVAVNYFDTLGAAVLSGRGFVPADLGTEPAPVIVNQSFVQHVLQGRNAPGRRVRYLADGWQVSDAAAQMREPWHEIVGVVPDLGTIHESPHDLAAIYHPVAAGAAVPGFIAVHVVGEPGMFSSRLRAIAAQVDPALRLYDVTPLNRVGDGRWNEFDFLSRLLTMISSLAMLLALSGIYAAVACSVSRRTREIGIRVALGARRRGIAAAVLRQPLLQVGLGIVAGTGLVLALVAAVNSSGVTLSSAALIVAYAAVMMGVCLLACAVPTIRALRIEATEALRVDG